MDQDTFLTTVYVIVDDYCKMHQIAWPVRPGPAPTLSVSEVLTVSLLSRWARFGSDRDFYAYVGQHWRTAFPSLPERSHFNRLLRSVLPWLIGFSQFLVSQLRARQCAYEALDRLRPLGARWAVPLATSTDAAGAGWPGKPIAVSAIGWAGTTV